MAKELIKVTCYGKEETWNDRNKAMAFYLECMMCSEGSEQSRYVNIYTQLASGYKVCSDEV